LDRILILFICYIHFAYRYKGSIPLHICNLLQMVHDRV
jgi:hypothetical protein